MMLPYQTGHFDYDECFLGPGGFLMPDANEEKQMMSFYLQALAAALARQGLALGGPQPLRWLEPGIGDGSSTARFTLGTRCRFPFRLSLWENTLYANSPLQGPPVSTLPTRLADMAR